MVISAPVGGGLPDQPRWVKTKVESHFYGFPRPDPAPENLKTYLFPVNLLVKSSAEIWFDGLK